MRPSWPRRWRTPGGLSHGQLAALSIAVVLAGTGSVAALHGAGYPVLRFDSVSGALWVASQGPGQLALIDGPSAVVAARISIGAPGDDIQVAQHRGTGFVVDRTRGSVLRVDGGTWERSEAVRPIESGRAGLRALAGDDALYVVDDELGLVRELDPRSLAPRGAVQSLAAAGFGGSPPVIDGRGDLWALDGQNGDLLHLADTVEVAAPAAADPAAGRLVLAAGNPVVVDADARTAVRYGSDGRPAAETCIEVDPADTTVRVAGSSGRDEIYVVSGAAGTLRVSDLQSSRCHVAFPSIAATASDLGAPVELARRVFVPNFTTGQVVVVDLDSGRVVTTPDALVEPGSPFDLQVHDEFVVYNDRASEKAGVLRLDGTVQALTKYDVEQPQADVDDPGPGLPETPPEAPDVEPGPEPTSPPVSQPTSEPRSQPRAVPPSGPGARQPARPAPAPTTPAGPPPPATAVVGVDVVGAGSVDLTATGAASQCRPRCDVSLPVGTVVTLTAAPDPGSEIAGWDPACPEGLSPTCTLTVGDGGVTVTATFAPTVPPATVSLDRDTVDLSGSPPVTVTLTLAGGTGAETWSASSHLGWLSVTPASGGFDANRQAVVTIAYTDGGRASAVDGTTSGAVTIGLPAVAGQDQAVAVTANALPRLTPSCSLLGGSQFWRIQVEVDDADLDDVAVFAVFDPDVPGEPVALGREDGGGVWANPVFLDGPRTVHVYATDAEGSTDEVPLPTPCG